MFEMDDPEVLMIAKNSLNNSKSSIVPFDNFWGPYFSANFWEYLVLFKKTSKEIEK